MSPMSTIFLESVAINNDLALYYRLILCIIDGSLIMIIYKTYIYMSMKVHIN